jgi:hypothetical protein
VRWSGFVENFLSSLEWLIHMVGPGFMTRPECARSSSASAGIGTISAQGARAQTRKAGIFLVSEIEVSQPRRKVGAATTGGECVDRIPGINSRLGKLFASANLNSLLCYFIHFAVSAANENIPTFAVLTTLAALASFPAMAKDGFHFDAAACKMDAKGHLYIALGRYVLAVPFSEDRTYLLDSVPASAKRLAPDPTEPEGCPGNPTQQRSFGFYFPAPLTDADGPSSKSVDREAPTRLTLYEVWKPNPNADQDHPEWSGESLTDSVVRSRCDRASVRERLPGGLNACRIQPVDKSRVEDWAASYIADPSVYATPLGRPFMVDCGPRLYSHGISHCNVAYSLARGLAVGYEFQPYLGQSRIPIDHIIEFDRKIRAQIDVAIVKEFLWPNQ